MNAVLSIVDYVIIGIMLTISASVGIYFRFSGGRQKTIFEYLLANKSMGILPVSFSILATFTSAVSTVGNPTETYLYGAQMMVVDAPYPLAVFIVAYCMLPVYFEMDVNSMYEYIEKRFGKAIRVSISVLYTIQMLLYIPVVIYAPSLALNIITGLPVWTSVISMALVCTFYSTLGGLKAILWTDFFQAIFMYFTLFALIIKGSIDFGGFGNILKVAEEGQRTQFLNTSTDLTVRYTLWNSLVQGLVFGLILNGTNFHGMQRLISCGNLKKAQYSLMWSVPMCMVFQACTYILGIVMYSYFNQCDPITNKEVVSGDQLTPLFIMKLFEHLPGLPGLCAAGIFSASLSTMSSVVNSMAFVTLDEYIKPFIKTRHLKESTATFIVKSLALFYGGLCLCLTFVIANAKGTLEAAQIFDGIVGGPTLGVICLGLFTSTANEFGSLFGLFSSFALMAWIGFGSLYNQSKYPPLPLSADGCPSNLNNTLFGTIPTLRMQVFNSTADATYINNTTEGYIFKMHEISYMWFSTISFSFSFIVGYIASYIIGKLKRTNVVDPQYISPCIRKWIFKSALPEGKREYFRLWKSTKVIIKSNNKTNKEEEQNEFI